MCKDFQNVIEIFYILEDAYISVFQKMCPEDMYNNMAYPDAPAQLVYPGR
jgi:hypothetical protein